MEVCLAWRGLIPEGQAAPYISLASCLSDWVRLAHGHDVPGSDWGLHKDLPDAVDKKSRSHAVIKALATSHVYGHMVDVWRWEQHH